MSFQVPFSSSPPSTPDRRSKNGADNTFNFGANPSNTPAGRPPSSAGTFTPAGPPPSSFLGSSIIGSSNPVKPLSFSQQSAFSESPNFMRSQAEPRRSGLSNHFQASPQRGFQVPDSDDDEEEEEEEGGEGYGSDHMDEEEDRYQDERHPNGSRRQYDQDDAEEEMDEDGNYDEQMDDYDSDLPTSRTNGRAYDQYNDSDLMLSQVGALRQSREGGMPGSSPLRKSQKVVSQFDQIAKGLYTQMPIPPLDESDDLILDTERLIGSLHASLGREGDQAIHPDQAFQETSSHLRRLWENYSRMAEVPESEEYTASIGPNSKAPNFMKANFIAGLALRIHHPEEIDRSLGNSFSRRHTLTLPEILLEWMDDYHNPYPTQFEEILAHRPSPAAHPLFWDTIFNSLIRGRVLAVVNLMKDAGWRHARNETDNPRDQPMESGFSGTALRNVERVISAAIQVLGQCPAAHGDWNISSNDWTLFRLRASQALEDLRSFAEGRSRGNTDLSTNSQSGAYSRAAQKAESQVPWHLYQNLVALYNLVMGDANAIVDNSQDWCEATVGLVSWWVDGKDEKRLALGRSQRASTRLDVVEAPFKRKLRESFALATAKSTDFEVNSVSETEVALASLFEGNIEAVVGFLRGWSGPVSSGVAEVASLAGWLPPVAEKSLISLGGLDEEDLDLLGINASPSKTDGVKDKTLIAYARALSHRGELCPAANPALVREGWELAIEVLGRMDSEERSEDIVGDFLKQFPLESPSTVDKLWMQLNTIGMNTHAENLAEAYADSLAEGSYKYGTALWYYALAHKIQKVKDVLDLLISFSLIQSTAYPPEAEMDEHLKALVLSPEKALTDLSWMDREAAELLHKLLSGYATLRKFFTIRDEEVQLSPGSKPKRSLKPRKTEAAAALIAVITSSDDNIRGGLYDEERGAVVSVDFLLALLGEALVFVNQPDYSITVPQIEILLKAIEDIQTVGPRVYTACTEFLQTVVASGQGLKGSTPADMLKKSTSNISGSSFSMVGSSMLASQLKQSMSSSGVLVKGNVKRGWDWRRSISAGLSADDMLRILRHGLAKDLAKAWLMEADHKM